MDTLLKILIIKPGKLLPIKTMGAIQLTSAIYLTISDGRICRRVSSPTSTSKERISEKSGKIYHEEFYKGWSGKITNVTTRDSDFGKEWQIAIQDENGLAILSFKYSSGYASSFLKALPNVDLSKDVVITPNVTTVGDKKRTTIFMNQEGQPVKWFYTKDNPNGCPSMEKIKVKGQEVWDDSKMMEFLENKVASLLGNDNDDAPF
jgi:hypothetical protein